MFKIAIILAVLCFTTILNNHIPAIHLHNSPSMHTQKKADNLYFQNQFTEMKTLVDYVSKSLEGKDPKKYQFLIQKSAQLQAGLNKLRQTLLKYNLPLSKQSKICPGVTTFNRTELRRYISYLQQKQAAIDQYMASCVDCNFVANDTIQIKNLTSTYLHHLNQTLDGKYCKNDAVQKEIAKGMVNLNSSYFKNNLKAKNWYYGSTTASDYKIYLFKRASTFNLTNCPISYPFVIEKQQQCFNCPVGSIFNVGAQKCDTCGQFQILVMESGKCVPCQGEKVVTNGNLVCKLCILSSGELLNKTSGKCYTCPSKTYLDTTLLTCVVINCNGDTPKFNTTTKKCEACEPSYVIDPIDITKCIKTNYIGMCHPNTPIYNPTTKNCTACPTDTIYNSDTNTCIKSNQATISKAHATVNHHTSVNTHRAVNTTANNSQINNTSPNASVQNDSANKQNCTKQYLYYNTVKKVCERCADGTQFVVQLQTCQKKVLCGPTQTLNKTSRICEQTSSTCRTNEVYVAKANRCLPKSMTCGQHFYYNPQKQTCIAISTNCKPDEFYDTQTRKCTLKEVKCKAQQQYDQKLHICKKLIHCQDDQQFNFTLRICEKKALQCNKYQYFDNATLKCLSYSFITSPYTANLVSPVHFGNYIRYYQNSKKKNPLLKDCPAQTPYFDQAANICISCAASKPYFDLTVFKCIPCPTNTFYDPSHHNFLPPRSLQISPTIKRMGI